MDIRFSCVILFFFVLLIDALFFEVLVHDFFVDRFGAYNEV